jgi:hypothetical protein
MIRALKPEKVLEDGGRGCTYRGIAPVLFLLYSSNRYDPEGHHTHSWSVSSPTLLLKSEPPLLLLPQVATPADTTEKPELLPYY